jgi:molybdopterin biosynthesis enzyme MoaB
MRKQFVFIRPVRVGIVAVFSRDESGVGLGASAAWEASGAAQIASVLPQDHFAVVRPLVTRGDNLSDMEKLLKDWSSAPNRNVRCDLILTLGGDGLAPRDILPDATLNVIDREILGIPEYLRQRHVLLSKGRVSAARPYSAALSRATAGTYRQTLIVNIPSYYSKAADAVKSLLPLIPEALSAMGTDIFAPHSK